MFLEMATIPCVGGQSGTRIIAACKYGIRLAAVQIGHTCQEAVYTVGGFNSGHGVVAPHEAIVMTLRLIADGIQLSSRFPLENCQILWSIDNKALELSQLVFVAP
ncbi:hypothetical protein D3C73_1498790 [compost metagenome]